jgi:hypothetical protein
VRVEDTLDYGNRFFRRAYTHSYFEVSAHAPALWRLFYEDSNVRDPQSVELTGADLLIYCVVTDVIAHCFWATLAIDGYFVASELTRDQLITLGVGPAIIHVSGLPVDPAIAERKTIAAMRTPW